MKKFIFLLSVLASYSIWALHPRLEKTVKLVEQCWAEEQVLLCGQGIVTELTAVHMDARGEFVYFIKELLNKNENEKVVSNLFVKLQELLPVYESLDAPGDWSVRDLKLLLGDVSARYVKMSRIDVDFLKRIYKAQVMQTGRYGVMLALLNKSDKVTSLDDMEKLVEFGEFAKDYSRQLKDEYYLYQMSVELIKKMTIKALKQRPGHEGIYEVRFENPDLEASLKLDRMVIIESGDRDALVVNFVSTQSRVIKFFFKGAGILGDQFFSNEDVYHNDPNLALPFFKFYLNRREKTLQGYFTTARFGKSAMTGRLLESNLGVYEQANNKGLALSQILGEYRVLVGAHVMTLKLIKRDSDRSLVEGVLFNDNAMIVFSKVDLNAERGVLTLVDISNERKMTLGLSGPTKALKIKGQLIVSSLAQVFAVSSK